MSRYKLTTQASLDLENILRYTKETWGFDQAKKYGSKIFNTFDKIADSPKIGAKADYIFKNIQKLNVNSHIVIYTIKEKQVTILRVLHQSMDIENQEIGVNL